MTLTEDPVLTPLNQLVGAWTTEATHPALPGVIAHGTAIIEWLEGERFLIHRARTDHPDLPDSISIIGITERDRIDPAAGVEPVSVGMSPLRTHYFDSRGVARVYEASVDKASWRLWRHAPGFSQRFTGTFADGGRTIAGRWQLCRDDIHWADDLEITYRRQK